MQIALLPTVLPACSYPARHTCPRIISQRPFRASCPRSVSMRSPARKLISLSAEPADAALLREVPEPEDARGAIAIGLELYNAGNYQKALELFDKALALPGTGIKQYRDKPPAISNGEKQAALYNIACCHSRLGNSQDGLLSLTACLEAGFEDYQQLREDPDLEGVREDKRFETLIGKFNRSNSNGFFGSFLKGFKL